MKVNALDNINAAAATLGTLAQDMKNIGMIQAGQATLTTADGLERAFDSLSILIDACDELVGQASHCSQGDVCGPVWEAIEDVRCALRDCKQEGGAS